MFPSINSLLTCLTRHVLYLQGAMSASNSRLGGGGGSIHKHVISHLLVLLTDGQPTHGVTHAKTILDNAKKRNRHNAAIFALIFGKDAELDLLERLALQVSHNFF